MIKNRCPKCHGRYLYDGAAISCVNCGHVLIEQEEDGYYQYHLQSSYSILMGNRGGKERHGGPAPDDYDSIAEEWRTA